MGMCKASASRSVGHRISQCLCSLASEWITFPSASQELKVNDNIFLVIMTHCHVLVVRWAHLAGNAGF